MAERDRGEPPAGDAPSGSAAPWRALPAILIGALLAQFDLFVVNVAAPSIQSDLDTTSSAVQLVVSAYSVTYGTLLMAGGRLGDVYGPQRLIRIGMIGFALASAFCAVVQTAPQLIVARIVQGAFAAILVPQVLGLITRMFPPDRRGTATAWFGVTLGVGAVLGQALGGYLAADAPWGLGWRSVFLVVVLPAVLGAVLVGRLVPNDTARPRGGRPRLDGAGLLGLTVGLMCVLVGVTTGPERGWPGWSGASLATGGVTLSATALWVTLRARRGLPAAVDPALFRRPVFRVGLLVNAAFFFSFGGVLFVLTFALQQGLHQSPTESGLTFVPQGAAFAVASLIGARLVNRMGFVLVVVGSGLSSTACLLLLIQSLTGGIAGGPEHLWPFMALLGIGNGLAIPAMISSVLRAVDVAHAGAAAGTLTTTQQVGMAFGVAVLGSLHLWAVTGSSTHQPGLELTLMIATVLLALAGLAAATLPRR